MENLAADATKGEGFGCSCKRIQAVALWVLFAAILALGTANRFQGITERGILAYDSADIYARVCCRIEGHEPLGVPRFQPVSEYLYVLGMKLLGKHDYAPMAVNALFDVGSMALLFFLSRRILRNAWAALACMGLYAVMWGAIGLSHQLTTHPVATFFTLVTFWVFIRYTEEVERAEDGRPLRWLALSGIFAGISLASHMSVEFLCVAFVVLIAMKTASLEGMTHWKKLWRFLLHAAIFSTCVFSVIGVCVCTELASRGSKALLEDVRVLSNLRTTNKWVLERHYKPRVAANKIRPTITSGTLDHLTLGTESLVNGEPALDDLTNYWYGDNPYSLAVFLNIPIMIFLAGRRRKGLFPGYALYVLTTALILGFYVSYTAYYVQHFRYLLNVMPFLIINLFFWVLLLSRELLPRRCEALVVIAVALAGFWGQKITLPGDQALLEPTPVQTDLQCAGRKGNGACFPAADGPPRLPLRHG